MSLKTRIHDDMKIALKARATERLAAIRLLIAAIKQKEIDERIELDDASVVTVIDKMIKQRRDSIAQYEAAQRIDLANKERFELNILMSYLPSQLTAEEINTLIEVAVQQSGAASLQDMSKVMGIVKSQMAGRADMSMVAGCIKARLAQHKCD